MTHDEIEALLAAATPGEWEWVAPDPKAGWEWDGSGFCVKGGDYLLTSWGHDAWGIECSEADADLIAAAPTVIRQLLDELRRYDGAPPQAPAEPGVGQSGGSE